MLGMDPVRLPILFDDGQLLVLAKPPGVLVQADAWFPRLPVLIEAIRYQAQSGKPEFQRLGIHASGLWAVTDLDPECHGPVVFTRDREMAEALRSDLGSGNFMFVYRLLSRSKASSDPLVQELPLARHRQQDRMLVSHTTGKAALTEFRLHASSGGLFQYAASTRYPRRHQILVHSHESGLPVLGDTRYAREHPLLLSRIKRHYQPKKDTEERPLYDGPAYFLESIDLGNGVVVTAPPPPKWNGLIRQLERHLGR